jgi:serine/threonine-protein kinase
MADFASALRGGPVTVPAAAAAAALPEPPAEVEPDAPDATRVLPVGAAVPPRGTPPPSATSRRRPAWLPWAGAALGVLLVVVLLAWLGRGDEPATTAADPGSETPSAAESASPSPSRTRAPAIVVNADDYVGLPKDEAKTRLEELGLRVKEEKVENLQGAPEDTVADVDPTGRVKKGTEITLSVWGKPVVEKAPPKPKPEHGKGKGHEKKGH